MARIVSWRKLRFRFDWTLTAAAVAVASLGLMNLWSAVHDRSSGLFTQQTSWFALGTVAFLAVASLDYRTISRYAYVFYGVGVALLIGILGFGKMVSGGRRWFDLGPVHLQPSEMMQVLTVVALGKYLNDSPALEGRSFRHLLFPVVIVSAPALLIAKQPDFGTAFLFLLIFITIMLTARLKLKTLAAILGLAAIAAFPIYQHLLREYQRKRFESFFDLNSEGAYQTRQALNAIGSGRIIGKGFLHGTQVRLRRFPALWTDFPFAVWAEEWGFLGSLAILLGVPRPDPVDHQDRQRGARSVRRDGVRRRGRAAVLARRDQRRNGQRHPAGRRRDAAADQLRRLERPHDHGRAGSGDERERAPLRVLNAGRDRGFK